MWIEKNGVIVATGFGAVPANVVRSDKLLGESNFPGDTPLDGEISFFDIVNV